MSVSLELSKENLQLSIKRFVVLLTVTVLSIQVVLLYHIDRFGSVDHAQNADVIIVLGAGLDQFGQPTASLVARAIHAASLYQVGFADKVLCSGGVTRNNFPSEATICAQILENAGLPRSAVELEEKSRSTQENAIQSIQWMSERSVRTAIVVSSSYHLWRASWLFHRLGYDVYTSPAPANYLGPTRYFHSLLREVLAVNWQYFVNLFGLPWTGFPPNLGFFPEKISIHM